MSSSLLLVCVYTHTHSHYIIHHIISPDITINITAMSKSSFIVYLSVCLSVCIGEVLQELLNARGYKTYDRGKIITCLSQQSTLYSVEVCYSDLVAE